MRKQLLVVLMAAVMLSLLTLTACGLLQEPEGASGPIEAIPLQQQPEATPAEVMENEPEVAEIALPTAESTTVEVTRPMEEAAQNE